MIDQRINRAMHRTYRNESLQSELLRNLRKTAVRRMDWWLNIVSDVQQRFPQYVVRDFTDLDDDVAFGVEIVLVDPSQYDRNDIAMATRLGGNFDYLQAFVSILGPWSYIMAIRLSVNATDDLPLFDKILKYANPQIEDVWNYLEHCFAKESIQTLPYEVATMPVPFGTDCTKAGEACVFHCLFSDILAP